MKSRDALITRGEEPNAVPIAFFRLRVWTFFGDSLWHFVGVHNLRVQGEKNALKGWIPTIDECTRTMPGQGGNPRTFARTTSRKS